MSIIKLSLATALCAFSMSATAQAYRVIGDCEFEAPDQEQVDDCRVRFYICPSSRTPALVEDAKLSTCKSGLGVRCGDTDVFKGKLEYDVNGTVVIRGVANDNFDVVPEVAFETPESLPADDVEATLDLDGVDYAGRCELKKDNSVTR